MSPACSSVQLPYHHRMMLIRRFLKRFFKFQTQVSCGYGCKLHLISVQRAVKWNTSHVFLCGLYSTAVSFLGVRQMIELKWPVSCQQDMNLNVSSSAPLISTQVLLYLHFVLLCVFQESRSGFTGRDRPTPIRYRAPLICLCDHTHSLQQTHSDLPLVPSGVGCANTHVTLIQDMTCQLDIFAPELCAVSWVDDGTWI